MVISPDRFQTHTLAAHPAGPAITRILAAAIDAVDPDQAVRRHLQRDGDLLQVDGEEYDLTQYRQIYLIAIGKAAVPMARAAAGVLGERLQSGIVVTKAGQAEPVAPQITVWEAGHPVPDERSVQAAAQVAELCNQAKESDLIVLLISGGGSALVTAPREGLTLTDLQQLTRLLLAAGASIDEINSLRKHLDGIKGGGLARLAAPATVLALVLSDVIGDPLEVIASGPVSPDPTTFDDCWAILDRYGLTEQIPTTVVQVLQKGRQELIAETAKPGDPIFIRVHYRLIGSNRQAACAALNQARQEGLNGMLLTTSLLGEAREAGRFLAAVGREMASGVGLLPRPACLVVGGETTVTLRGSGTGGRNLELALGAVIDLAGVEGVILVTLATDGGDGSAPAAGAVVTGGTLARARQLGLDPRDYLVRNDSYPFFHRLGDALVPGPTQTNVNDLALVIAL